MKTAVYAIYVKQWNNYNMIQPSLQTKYMNGNNPRLRRHGSLTTFDGLVLFRKLVAERDHCPEEVADVINYDYQILDDAWWILDEMGYGIVKKDSK